MGVTSARTLIVPPAPGPPLSSSDVQVWGAVPQNPAPITKTQASTHLSPKGSRTANLVSLPRTWLIYVDRAVKLVRGFEG